jgi:hypothetical protein
MGTHIAINGIPGLRFGLSFRKKSVMARSFSDKHRGNLLQMASELSFLQYNGEK